jgi:hypothetical protein
MSSLAASAVAGASAPTPATRASALPAAHTFFRAKRGRDEEDTRIIEFEALNRDLTLAKNVLRDSLAQVTRIASETPECPIEIDFVLRRHIAPLIARAQHSEQQIRKIVTILGMPDMVEAFVATTKGAPHSIVREWVPRRNALVLEDLNSSLATIREHEKTLIRRLDAISDACRTD